MVLFTMRGHRARSSTLAVIVGISLLMSSLDMVNNVFYTVIVSAIIPTTHVTRHTLAVSSLNESCQEKQTHR